MLAVSYCVLLYRSGLIDHLGIEPLMMEALEKIEKDIKKPLLRSDKKNMATLLAEFDKINKKYANICIFHLNNVFSVANLLDC
jgi:hypothetical protein